MAFSCKEFFIGGRTFCCCLPVRLGVVLMSLFTILLAGAGSILFWFETGDSNLTEQYRAIFILAGVVESLLFLVSILGFAGAIARKQLFVHIYAIFLYFHLLVNVGVLGYVAWMINHAAHNDILAACQKGVKDAGAQDQCSDLIQIVQGVFAGVAGLSILIELYGAFIATRYFRLLRNEKRIDRQSRLMTASAFNRHSRGVSAGQSVGLLDHSPYAAEEFDPYSTYEAQPEDSHAYVPEAYAPAFQHEPSHTDVAPVDAKPSGYAWSERQPSLLALSHSKDLEAGTGHVGSSSELGDPPSYEDEHANWKEKPTAPA
ncbi:hypothetical protein PLICRDRAFT_37348 [Plicaturopsis crispa FD-325 SS-3]|nr:hypothetical protein PLICRDRAFT_37348 [Plicaturopsis crispa FD-325 SS-3]